MKSITYRSSTPMIAALLVLTTVPAHATPMCCNCNGGGPTKGLVANSRLSLPDGMLAGFRLRAEARSADRAELKFLGEVAGEFDDVDAYFTFPYSVPGVGELDVLLRGFPAQRVEGTDTYTTPRWDRSLYWLELGDGQPPRLLQALELDKDYVPAADDVFHDAVDNGAGTVTGDCVAGAGCTLNLVPYLRYREAGVDYSDHTRFPYDDAFPGGIDGFLETSLLFVTDANGDAIDAVVVLDDDTALNLYLGDGIQLATLAYRISEPDFIYALGYMDFVTLGETTVITRRNYIPGDDFVDPGLPGDLAAGDRRIRLVLEASTAQGTDYSTGGARNAGFQYGGPFDLGFTWAQAPAFVYKDTFEYPQAVTQLATRKSLVRTPQADGPRTRLVIHRPHELASPTGS